MIELAARMSRIGKESFPWLYLGLGLLAIAAVVIVAYATRVQPWAFSDGAGYVMLARNVLSGRGLGLMRASGDFQPLSMHPPLYPLSLAAIGLSGAELLMAARWVDALLFALTITIVGITIHRVSRNVWLAMAAGAVTLVTPSLVGLYTGTMSEPLSFVLGLGGFLSLLIYFNSGQRGWLVLAGVAAGAAVITRYLAIAYVGAGFVCLLIFGAMKLKRRGIDSVIFAAVSAVPTFVWFAWVNAQSGAVAPRQWQLDLSSLWARTEPLRGGVIAELWTWIPFAAAIDAVPYRYQLGVVVLVVLAIGSVLLLALRQLHRRGESALRELVAVQSSGLQVAFIAIYMGILSVVFLFGRPPLDAGDIDRRILTPVYLAAILLLFSAVALAQLAWPRRRWVIPATLIITLLAITWFWPSSIREIRELNQRSRGYTSLTWLYSETVQSAAELPAGIPLITNESTAIMFYLDRAAYDIPELLRGERVVDFPRFGDGDFGEERIFREERAALVLFDSAYWQFRAVYDQDTDQRLQRLTEGLELHADLADGAIYFFPMVADQE